MDGFNRKTERTNYANRKIKAAAAVLKKIRKKPTVPAAVVKVPPPVIAGVAATIPVLATKVTVLAPAVLSMMKSRTVPLTPPIAAASNAQVGSVNEVAAADVLVMYFLIS